jgi:hypothetical protein
MANRRRPADGFETQPTLEAEILQEVQPDYRSEAIDLTALQQEKGANNTYIIEDFVDTQISIHEGPIMQASNKFFGILPESLGAAPDIESLEWRLSAAFNPANLQYLVLRGKRPTPSARKTIYIPATYGSRLSEGLAEFCLHYPKKAPAAVEAWDKAYFNLLETVSNATKTALNLKDIDAMRRGSSERALELIKLYPQLEALDEHSKIPLGVWLKSPGVQKLMDATSQPVPGKKAKTDPDVLEPAAHELEARLLIIRPGETRRYRLIGRKAQHILFKYALENLAFLHKDGKPTVESVRSNTLQIVRNARNNPVFEPFALPELSQADTDFPRAIDRLVHLVLASLESSGLKQQDRRIIKSLGHIVRLSAQHTLPADETISVGDLRIRYPDLDDKSITRLRAYISSKFKNSFEMHAEVMGIPLLKQQ